MLEARRPWQPERASSARAREPPAPEGPFSATKPFGELSRAATHLSALFARSDEQAPELPKYHDASATSTDAGPGVYALSCSQAARGNKFTGRELEVQCAYVPFLGDVDAHHSSFAARIDLDLTWAASEEDLRLAKEDPRGYAPGFVPDIVIKNAQTVETLFVAGKSGNVHQIQDGTKNFMRVRFEGTFVEEYSFAAFPFDVQTLTFVLGLSFYNSDELRFVLPPEKKGPFFYLLTRHSALPEWTPMRLLAGTHIVEGFSELLCKVQLKRDPRPYVVRIGAPCMLLNTLQFGIFTAEWAEGRVNLTLTIVLTYVAVIYTLTGLVPMAAGITIADRYVLLSIVVAVFGLGLSVLATFQPEGSQGPLFENVSADGWAALVIFAMQVSMHAYMGAAVLNARRVEGEKLTVSFEQEEYNSLARNRKTLEFPRRVD